MMALAVDTRPVTGIRVGLPVGYAMRPGRGGDLQEVVEMLNKAHHQLSGVDKFTPERLGREWSMPGFNLESDSQVVLAPDGAIVAYYDVFDLYEPHVRINCYGKVHPNYADKGLASAMLKWAEARACQSIPLAPANAQVMLLGTILSFDRSGHEIYKEAGFRLVRESMRMSIDLDQELSKPVWPGKVKVRKFVMGKDDENMIHAIRESFSDHWGFVESPFEAELASFRHLWANDPNFDPDLYFLAVNGEEIAGFSLCYRKIEEDPEMGWVGSLGVRRAWRRQGIGLALLLNSFQELKRIGKKRAGLGVDAQNLTGATRLYEKAGMQPIPGWGWSTYAKELRPGVDISTQTLVK
jgi:mycothiol synthase